LVGGIGRQADADHGAAGVEQSQTVAFFKRASDRDNARGQQTLARLQGAHGAVVQRQGAARRHAAGDPLLPGGERRGGGGDQGGARALGHGLQRVKRQTRGDDGGAAGGAGDLGRR